MLIRGSAHTHTHNNTSLFPVTLPPPASPPPNTPPYTMHFRSREILFRPFYFCSDLFLLLQPNVMVLLSGSHSSNDILLVRRDDLLGTVSGRERGAISRKVKLRLSTSLRCRGSNDVAPLTLYLGAGCRWVVSFKPWLLYPRERDPVDMECEAGCGSRKY